MLCHAMLCYAMLCYAMLRYAMLCYAKAFRDLISSDIDDEYALRSEAPRRAAGRAMPRCSEHGPFLTWAWRPPEHLPHMGVASS